MSQFAISSNKSGRKSIQREIPKPGKHEVLIKNVAVASNPKDWKLPLWFDHWQDHVEGNDVAGYIEAVGEGVSEYKKGDKVAAFSRMVTDSDHGAYQEYTLAPANCTFPIADKVKFEDAATLPLAVMTACIGLFVDLKLPLPQHPPKQTDQWIAVNGAASSVGAFACQLAKLAGLKVVGVASKEAYAKENGADVVVNYRGLSDDELSQKLQQEFSSRKISTVYDAVATKSTVSILAKALQPDGGEIGVVLPNDSPSGDLSNVKVTLIQVGTSYTKERYDQGAAQNSEFARKWFRQIGQWLGEGVFRGNDVQLMPKGLESVDEGMALLQDDKVSAKKLVYRITDTPSLKK